MPRTRTERVRFYLSKPELEKLNRAVQKSGLKREAYLRSLIKKLIPADRPPPDYFKFMEELHAIGNNLNQIARKANSLNLIDAHRFDEEARKLDNIYSRIQAHIMQPTKVT
jgi:hypothetical protein